MTAYHAEHGHRMQYSCVGSSRLMSPSVLRESEFGPFGFVATLSTFASEKHVCIPTTSQRNGDCVPNDPVICLPDVPKVWFPKLQSVTGMSKSVQVLWWCEIRGIVTESPTLCLALPSVNVRGSSKQSRKKSLSCIKPHGVRTRLNMGSNTRLAV